MSIVVIAAVRVAGCAPQVMLDVQLPDPQRDAEVVEVIVVVVRSGYPRHETVVEASFSAYSSKVSEMLANDSVSRCAVDSRHAAPAPAVLLEGVNGGVTRSLVMTMFAPCLRIACYPVVFYR